MAAISDKACVAWLHWRGTARVANALAYIDMLPQATTAA